MIERKKIKAISLFSSAGIGELYFKDANIQVVVANELLDRRCELYKYFHKGTDMIC
jgi:DNA (cytosine-5)-methyltransferase 1